MIQRSYDNSARSAPHRRIEKILDEMGINYVSENHFHPYTVDIYLPEWHLGIEIDGPYHNKIKDKSRDQYLRDKIGLPILRINVMKWVGKNKVKQLIMNFIEDNAHDVEQRQDI